MKVLLDGGLGVLGVLARYALSAWFPSIWTVAAINVAGSFVLGLFIHVAAGWSSDLRTAVAVGFLGGFTTFSTMTVQAVLETDGGRGGRAAAYLAISIGGGLLAAAAGYAAGKLLS